MSNIVQIKRSTTAAAPSSLANGELAFTSNGDILYIGSPNGSIIGIGGLRTPGTLTANQALVANSTSGINEIRTAIANVGSIYANGSFGTAGQVLTSNSSGIFWNTPAAGVAGSDTQIQFNDGGVLAGDSGLTFNKTTDTLSTNSLFATSTVNAATLSVGSSIVANSSRLALGTSVGLEANGTIGTAGQILTSNGSTVYWGAAGSVGTVTSVDSGIGLTGGPITSSGTLSVLANNGIIANTTGLFVKSANGISVTSNGVNVDPGTNSGLVSNTSGLFVVAGSGLLTNSSGIHVGSGNGISVSTDAIAINAGNTLVANTSGLYVNPELSITNLTLSGNLVINGSTTTVNTEILSVSDPLIELARNNTANSVDIGFYGQYSDDAGSTIRYTGIVWDASASVYELFANTTVEPTSTINTGGAGYIRSTLKAFVDTGAFVSNTSAVSITANSSIAVTITANTLSLTTALAGTSGGTGKTTMTNNAILVGNSTNGYNELVLGTAGYVLQSNGTALIYDVLDGGTF